MEIKKKNLRDISFYFFLLLFVFKFCIACDKQDFSELKRETKFTLNYGGFENELNLFNLNSLYPRPDSQIFMKDGIFYISNSSGQKILKMSSFGDLLSFYYNPDTNPIPDFDIKNEDSPQKTLSTRLSVKYKFNHPGLLAVTNSKHLYVVDTVFDDKIEYDYEENLVLRDVILHFDENGNFIDYHGQDGLSGIPFPSIEGIHTNSSNDLIVICRTQIGFKIYWYNENGALLYKIPIFLNTLPIPYESSVKFFSSVDKIVPDFSKLKLYIKTDYYIQKKDNDTQAALGMSYDKSILYVIDIAAGTYKKLIDIAPYDGSENLHGEIKKFQKVYELLGVTQDGYIYLTTPISSGYALKILNSKSQKQIHKKLLVEDFEIFYNSFNLSETGIISALLAQNDKTSVVWWRADKLIGER